jgi:hypothetical protein
MQALREGSREAIFGRRFPKDAQQRIERADGCNPWNDVVMSGSATATPRRAGGAGISAPSAMRAASASATASTARPAIDTTPAVLRRKPLRGIHRSHAPRDLGSVLTFDHGIVLMTLQIKPELCAVSKITAEPHRRFGGDRPAAI